MDKEEAIKFVLGYLGDCIRHGKTNGCPDLGDLMPNDFKLFEVSASQESEEDDWDVEINFRKDPFFVCEGDPEFTAEHINVCIGFLEDY